MVAGQWPTTPSLPINRMSIKKPARNRSLKSCRRRSRTFTEGLALIVSQHLSPDLHPRERRAWLPVSSPYSVLVNISKFEIMREPAFRLPYLSDPNLKTLCYGRSLPAAGRDSQSYQIQVSPKSGNTLLPDLML